jgi:uncharacterized protein YdhG (YjbR/CyaY superfamily)
MQDLIEEAIRRIGYIVLRVLAFGRYRSGTEADRYITAFPAAVQARLQSIRRTVKKVAPDVQATISCQIPTFTLGGNLIHFAAFRNHVGVYPGASAIEALQKDLAVSGLGGAPGVR